MVEGICTYEETGTVDGGGGGTGDEYALSEAGNKGIVAGRVIPGGGGWGSVITSAGAGAGIPTKFLNEL